MINRCSEEIIRSLPEVFRLSVPVYLCLGNHDLTHPDAWKHWLNAASNFFPAGKPYYSVRLEKCYLHIVPNQWGNTPYYWKEEQDSRFLDEQLEEVGRTIRQNPGCTHLFCTHSNVIGVLSEQTGFDRPYNSPKEFSQQQVFKFADMYPKGGRAKNACDRRCE